MKAPSIENISLWNRTVYNLESKSMQLFEDIMLMLGKIKPMRSNDNYKRIWLSEERGSVSDMGFDNREEAMAYFEADNEADLQKVFLKQYPDDRCWFMVEALSNEDCRILKLKYFAICIYSEIPDHVDVTPYDLEVFLQWVTESLSGVMIQVEEGTYLENVEKELPYQYRYGTIGRKELYERRPGYKERQLKDLTFEEIEQFIQIINQEGVGYIPEGRIKGMTFDMYFDYASKAFAAAGYDIKGMTPYEQFKRYGEDFGGHILENLPHDSADGFLYYYDEKNHMGGHPWGLVRGSSRTRIFLWPRKTNEGFYFIFSGNEVFMAYELVKMYLALKDSGLPVRFSGCKESVIRYLRQEDLIGIVPAYEMALYCQHEFPDQEVKDFIHYCPEDDTDIADFIEWQPLLPIIFKVEDKMPGKKELALWN